MRVHCHGDLRFVQFYVNSAMPELLRYAHRPPDRDLGHSLAVSCSNRLQRAKFFTCACMMRVRSFRTARIDYAGKSYSMGSELVCCWQW